MMARFGERIEKVDGSERLVGEMGQTVVFGRPSDEVIAAVTTTLSQRGYRVMRSFDLQEARTHHEKNCPCPHHGTELCTCQYVVLLVYPQASASGWATDELSHPPRVLTVDTYEQATFVTFHRDETISRHEVPVITSALIEAVTLLALSEPSKVPSPVQVSA